MCKTSKNTWHMETGVHAVQFASGGTRYSTRWSIDPSEPTGDIHCILCNSRLAKGWKVSHILASSACIQTRDRRIRKSMPKYIRPPFSYSTGTHSFRLGIPMLETWYFFITEPLRSSEAKLRLLRNPLFDSFDLIISLGIWKVQLFIKERILASVQKYCFPIWRNANCKGRVNNNNYKTWLSTDWKREKLLWSDSLLSIITEFCLH